MKKAKDKADERLRFIRVREVHHFKAIEDLARVIWEEHYTPIIGAEQVVYMLRNFQSAEAVEKQIQAGMQYYLVGLGSVPVGYLAFNLEPNGLFLSKIYVLKEKRGMGLGRASMEFVESKASDLGRNAISLTVNKNNSHSIRAYEKMGFVNLDAIETDIGSGFVMDDYLMRKEL